jgi:hypothetical protein
MPGDVGGDWRRQEVGAGVAGGEAFAEAGGGNILVDGVEEVDAGLLGGSERQTLGELQGDAGAADYDPLGELEEAKRRAPVGEVLEAVGAGEVEEFGGGVVEGKGFEGVDGVVCGAVLVGGVDARDAKSRGVGGGAGELGHGEALAVGGGVAVALERLASGGREEDAVEVEGVGGRAGDGDVTAVGRVEAAAEEGYAHGQGWTRQRSGG